MIRCPAIKLLALDTATDACSVAIYNQGRRDSLFELTPREHTQRILPMVDNLLNKQQLNLDELNALVYCRGPGSFTGVRIGIGIAQGLALGANLPMIAVSSLAALAEGAWRRLQATRVLVAVDARMGEVYWGEYQRTSEGGWQGEESECVFDPAQGLSRMAELDGTWLLAGTGWGAYFELSELDPGRFRISDVTLPDAQDMLEIAISRLDSDCLQKVDEIEAVYLRNEITWKKLPGR